MEKKCFFLKIRRFLMKFGLFCLLQELKKDFLKTSACNSCGFHYSKANMSYVYPFIRVHADTLISHRAAANTMLSNCVYRSTCISQVKF